jgi:ribosomal protein L16 Arg81 hydroxylase
MILLTMTYISLRSNNPQNEAKVEALEAELAYFCKTQEDVDLNQFLSDFLTKKPLLIAAGVDDIAVFHTLFYDNQCNTEFSPKTTALIHDIGATFCLSVDRFKSVTKKKKKAQ